MEIALVETHLPLLLHLERLSSHLPGAFLSLERDMIIIVFWLLVIWHFVVVSCSTFWEIRNVKILMIDRVVFVFVFLFSLFLSHLKQGHQNIYYCQHLWPKSWRAGHLATVGVRNDQGPLREQVWDWKVNKFEHVKLQKSFFFFKAESIGSNSK